MPYLRLPGSPQAEPGAVVAKAVASRTRIHRGPRRVSMKKPFPKGWAHGAIATLALFMVLGPLYMEATVSPLRPYDEGAVLTSAFRMFGGEIRLRDFDPVYGPAESGILYLLSGSTGPELLHLRFLRYSGFALAAFFATLGAARLGGAVASLLAAALVLSFATPLTSPAFSLVLTSVVLADLANDRCAHSRLFLFAAGLTAGLALLFRLSFGALGCIAALTVISSERVRSDGASPLRERLSRAAVFAAGLAPGVITLGGLVTSGSAHIGWALNYETLAAYRNLPFPIPAPAGTQLLTAIETLVWAGLPLLVLLVSSVVLLVQFRKRTSFSLADNRRLGLQVGLTLLLLGLVPYALFRPDLVHFYPALVVSGCLGAGLLGRLGSLVPNRLRAPLSVCILLALGAVSASHLREAWEIRRSPDRVESALDPLRGLVVDRKLEAYYSEASQLVRSLTQPEDTLFVGSLDHRRILMNDPLLYAISGRRPATRHTCFEPGKTTTEAKQREMIKDLMASKPPVVFLVPSWRPEPNRSREFGSNLLDRFLQRSYQLHRRVGPSLLMVRREDPGTRSGSR